VLADTRLEILTPERLECYPATAIREGWMRRREFIAILSGGVIGAAWKQHAFAAERSFPPRVGFISGYDQATAGDFISALRDGLAAYRYVEPHSLKLDLLFANFGPERIPALVDQLEKERVDVIVTHAAATEPVVEGRRTIPAVYEFSADPVTLGIAKDLAHPLKNATGISLMAPELNGKRLELLHEIIPEVRQIAVLANPLHPGQLLERADSEAKARQLGIEISFFPIPNRAELDRALDTIGMAPPQAMVLFSDAFVVENREHIINFAMSRKMPVVSGWSVMAKAGALCTYGPRIVESYRRVAYFVDRILKGAKPAELPVEQPTVLELVVNRNSAKTLGITIPTSVLIRADEVIE
jgi:putative ABC transport system substrate-binding protein